MITKFNYIKKSSFVYLFRLYFIFFAKKLKILFSIFFSSFCSKEERKIIAFVTKIRFNYYVRNKKQTKTTRRRRMKETKFFDKQFFFIFFVRLCEERTHALGNETLNLKCKQNKLKLNSRENCICIVN